MVEHSFDTCVSFTFCSEILDPVVAKMATRKLTTQTSFFYFIYKLTYSIVV